MVWDGANEVTKKIEMKTETGYGKSIYERLYEVVEGNYQAARKSFGYKKSTFLCDVNTHPQNIDVSRYVRLPNVEFFQALFVSTYRRLPEKTECIVWEEKYSLPKEKFQEEALRSIARTGVVAINHVCFVNNPYFVQKQGVRYRLLGTLYCLTDKAALREFGKKLPQPMQRFARKIFL